ncbi:MAG: PEP-CTERM sorting domain-containing protein [Akkermansiaceae bacterium]|nr:PEP-CTERM sorting domain-containing protein [Akkermansiaceae bacterium]NNM27975.1 PEP-CTERM sorting domain-containing protein [Akkermansiaceae bacterium]
MKKALMLLGALGAFTAGGFGQSLVAHWDLDANDYWLPPNVHKYGPGTIFEYDENHFEECVDVEMTTNTCWSTRAWGSEHTPDYHCFGRFSSDFNAHKYVSWKVTFTGDAMGELTSFNFDIRNYDGSVNAFQLAWYSDGQLVGSENGTFGDSWKDVTVDLGGQGLDSNFGEEDEYEFRLVAYESSTSSKKKKKKSKSLNYGRIGLDNIRIHGDGVKCIPEPGTAMLGLLGLLPFILRRRR